MVELLKIKNSFGKNYFCQFILLFNLFLLLFVNFIVLFGIIYEPYYIITILLQLTFTFIYNIFNKNFSFSIK